MKGILKIKTVIPPLGSDVLSRPRIQRYLNKNLISSDGFTRQLTMMSAPAGFGKTTLVREWLAGRENQTAWLSLDEGDNEYERFWMYLVSALQRVESALGKGVVDTLRSGGNLPDSSVDGEVFLTPLLNELFELNNPVFLVLDDYHLVDNRKIHQDMIFFIENLPPVFHLVITTRSDPPWPLSRWRARDTMAEVRLEGLKFLEQETAELLSQYKGIQLSEAQLHVLYQKTEGWVTGLQLVAFSLSNSHNVDDFIQSFTGSHRHVFHFLSEEVFSRQPDPIQSFLLHVSIFNRFSGPLCDAMTGREDSSAILASLEKANVFLVPLDEEGTWYRCHPLFADFLLYKLKRSNPGRISELRDRAARWFLEAGEPGEAVRQVLANNNLELAGHIIHDRYEEILQNEGPVLLYHSLSLFSSSQLKKFPRLVAHMALFTLIKKGKEEAGIALEMAEELRYENEEDQKEYSGILAAVRSYYHIFSNRFPEALKDAEQALQLLPGDSYYWRMNVAIYFGDAMLFSGNPKGACPFYLEAHQNSQRLDNHFLYLATGFKLATSWYFLGCLQKAEELTEKFLRIAKSNGLSGISRIGLLWTLSGELFREKGELEEAERCIERGLLLSKPEKFCLGWNSLFKAALAFSKKEYREVVQTIQAIEALDLEVKLPLFITCPATIWEARVRLEQRELDRAGERLSAVGITRGSQIQSGQERGYLVLARMMLESGPEECDDVRKLLDQVSERAARGSYTRLALETLLVKACLEDKAGQPRAAVSHLKKALHEGKEAGFFQVFLDESGGLRKVYGRVIEELQKDASAPDHELLDFARQIHRTLWLVDDSEKNRKTAERTQETGPASINDLVEELSARELEVLDLIGQGCSNLEISENLFISLGTVKWHTSNIYGKLGVKGRTKALARARRLKIIP